MLIELREGMILHQGKFNAVIAPEKVVVSALNNNADLQRFLFLYVSGNYSRLLTAINRSSKNFEVHRSFIAHQLFTILSEASHTVVLLEHDPTLFEGAENMIPHITGMLKKVGRESLVIFYAPSIDNSFSVLMRQADHSIEIAPYEDRPGHTISRGFLKRRTLPTFAEDTGDVVIGRSFESIRQGVKSMADAEAGLHGHSKRMTSSTARNWWNWQRNTRARISLPVMILLKLRSSRCSSRRSNARTRLRRT